MPDPTPSPAALDAVRARVAALGGWATLGDDHAVLAALKADAVPNPAPRADVPRPFTAADLMAKLAGGPAGPRAKIYARPAMGKLIDKIDAQDRTAVGNLIQLAVDAGDIQPADQAALAAVLAATVPDPAWPATVPRIDLALGRPCTLTDVAAARPGA